MVKLIEVKRPITKHHVQAKSMGGRGKKNNVVLLDAYFHECWHVIYDNLTLVQAQLFVTIVMDTPPHGKWSHSLLIRLRKAVQVGNRNDIYTLICEAREARRQK